MHDADVVVVGAGPAGVAAALTAARAGLSVILFDQARFPRDKPCGEGLLPSAMAALAALGLERVVAPLGIGLEGIGLESAGTVVRTTFAGGGLGIARRRLDARLVEAARAEPQISVREGMRAKAVRRSGDGVVIESSAGLVHARAVVAADGLSSRMRVQLGLARRRDPRPGDRLGLRVHFGLGGPLPFGSFVHVLFEPGVELYMTPVGPAELQVAVLGSRAALAARGLAAATLVPRLRAHRRLGPLLARAEPLDRPLGAGPFGERPRAVVTDGAVLAGDAAGTLDPISGEGVGLALVEGRSAGATLAATLTAGRLPTAIALAGYARLHRRLRRDPARITAVALQLCHSRWLAERALAAMARRPDLLARLVKVQTGEASFTSVSLFDWARLVAG